MIRSYPIPALECLGKARQVTQTQSLGNLGEAQAFVIEHLGGAAAAGLGQQGPEGAAFIVRALATIVAAIVLVAVPHGPILVVFPITMAQGFSTGLFSTPLFSTPVVPAPIVSTIVPTAVMPVSVVMGKQWPWLLAGHAGQGRPRVAGSLDRNLNGCDFSCKNRA